MIKEQADVKIKTPRIKIEILDLDSCTTEDEINEAIQRELKHMTGEIIIRLLPPNTREQRKAIVEINENIGVDLLNIGTPKIAWVSARVRKRVEIIRCFKCHDYYHEK